MSSELIKAAVAGATAYLAEHPDEARYRDSAARAVLRQGFIVDVTGPAGEAVTTDMTKGIGGTASAPSPGWLLRAATASCVATLIALRAATQAVILDALEVTVDSESDDRGILGMDTGTPAGPLSTRIAVTIRAASADATLLREIVAWGTDHCPVVDALRRPIPIEVVVEA